jgi:hypothetical protein
MKDLGDHFPDSHRYPIPLGRNVQLPSSIMEIGCDELLIRRHTNASLSRAAPPCSDFTAVSGGFADGISDLAQQLRGLSPQNQRGHHA